jgi:hypothetical protein
MPNSPDNTKRREELAREQSLTVLEQAIGDREQVAGDRDQSRIDHEQINHDDRREGNAASDHREDHINDDRQAEELDKIRARLNLPTSEQPDAADAIPTALPDPAGSDRPRPPESLDRSRAAGRAGLGGGASWTEAGRAGLRRGGSWAARGC